MKAKLPEREPQQLAAWEEMRLYHRILDSRAGAPLFVLHDGPPYPTGEIHLGTGLNKILKDMIVKSKTMAGFRSPYIPGLGLPRAADRDESGKGAGRKDEQSDRRGIPPHVPRICGRATWKRTRRDFKRLGVFGQWDKPYLTMDPQHEASHRRRVHRFSREGLRVPRAEAGLLVHLRPHGAGRSRSGIRRSHQPVDLGEISGGGGRESRRSLGADVSALIWTTTPWTLPANRALAFHPDFEYVVADTQPGKLLLAKDRVGACAEELKIEVSGTHGSWKGKELEGIEVSASVSRFARAGRACRLRHARSGQRHRAHGAGPRRGRLSHRAEIRPRSLRAAG